MLFTAGEIARITGGELWLGKAEPGTGFERVIIDSREARAGDFFCPLQGEKDNGHNYILDALARGASGSFLEWKWTERFSRNDFPPEKSIVVVNDTLVSLQKLSSYHRNRFSLHVVAVTGSNGKTTTKDFIASVLSKRYNVLKTEGNYNNHIGLPLTLLRLKREHEVAVLEMAMRGLGEIALLASLSRPSAGVITNIGEAHMELLGSKDNIARAKGELLEALGAEGTAFLNGDDPFLRQMGEKFRGRTFYYGFGKEVDFRVLRYNLDDLGCKFEVLMPGGATKEFWSPLPGRHNVYNALAAISVGLHFSLDHSEILSGLAGCSFSGMRMERTFVKGGFWIINDAYNANPTSMKYALDFLQEWGAGKTRIAVLGDMFELGLLAEEGHREVGRYLADLQLDYLVAVGKMASMVVLGAKERGFPPERIFYAPGHKEAIEFLHSLPLAGSIILVKGSRGMKMEKIVEELLGRFEEE